jgi:hypothetical protein
MRNLVARNKVIAFYMDYAFYYDYSSSWDALMAVANRLKNENQSVSFTKEHLSFDIDVLFENVYEYIVWLNKNYEL